MSRSRLLALAIASLLTVACGGKSDKEKAKQRTKEIEAVEEARFPSLKQRFEPIVLAATQFPTVTADQLTDVAPLSDWPPGNTAVITEGDAKHLLFRANRPGGSEDSEIRYTGVSASSPPWAAMGDFASLGEWVLGESVRKAGGGFLFYTKEEAEAKLGSFDAIAYVIVIRILDHAQAVVKGAGYVAGHFKAEARIFDTKGVDHGGFHFEAVSSPTLTLRVGDEDSTLHTDLAENAHKALVAKLNQLVPGSTLKP